MSGGIWTAASGATTQLMSLDATANNLANANTPGFKGDSAVFREHLMTAVKGGRSVKEMRFSAVDAFAHDYSAGPINQAGRPLDAAVLSQWAREAADVSGDDASVAAVWIETSEGVR